MFLESAVFDAVRVPLPVAKFSPLKTNQHWPKGGWRDIVYQVCEAHRVKIVDLMAGDRRRIVVRCRWEIIRRMRDELTLGGEQLSRKQIGKRLGLDHTSVIYALRRMAGELPSDIKPGKPSGWERR